MINLLLLNNFYPIISHRRVQKEKKATNHCIRLGSLVMVRSRLPAQLVNLFVPNYGNIFTVFSIFTYNPDKTDNKFINSQ